MIHGQRKAPTRTSGRRCGGWKIWLVKVFRVDKKVRGMLARLGRRIRWRCILVLNSVPGPKGWGRGWSSVGERW